MILRTSQFLEVVGMGIGLCFILVPVGCQGISGRAMRKVDLSRANAVGDAGDASPTAGNTGRHPSGIAPGDYAVFARSVEKDAQGRSRCVWIRALDSQAAYRWYNPRLEEILARPSEHRPDVSALLDDSDPVVCANAAIARGREQSLQACPRLVAAVQSPDLPVAMRCAAAETLAALSAPAVKTELQKLIDQYGRSAKSSRVPYHPELHAELLRGLARHVDAAADPRFRTALRSPGTRVRREALMAWAAGREGALPSEAVDLRTHGDAQVRAAALRAIAVRRPPQALEHLTKALRDQDLSVRLTAVSALGNFGTPEALATLKNLLNNPSVAVRAEAVTALAAAGAATTVYEAANDTAWRVRIKVAEALAKFPQPGSIPVAEQLIADRSMEVRLVAVEAMDAWPIERAGPILLKVMAQPTFATRKAAAGQLAAAWPTAAEFPFDGPAARRAEILKKLGVEFFRQFGAGAVAPVQPAGHQEPALHALTSREMEELRRHLEQEDYAALLAYGDRLVRALEEWRFRFKRPLPEPVYRKVLPQCDPVFDVVDRLRLGDLLQRRRAAAEFAQAAKKPLSRLALDRLRQLLLAEEDPLIWQMALRALAEDDQPPVHDIARVGAGHASADVRRLSCDYLAAHPRREHVSTLLPALKDRRPEVVCAAVRALAASGGLTDTKPLRTLLGVKDENVQLAAARALAQTGDPAGKTALERLAFSRDPKVRAQTATAMGAFPDPAFVPLLIQLLDDKVTVARAALKSLPKVVGKDVSQPPGQPPAATTQRMTRWKQWHEKRSQFP